MFVGFFCDIFLFIVLSRAVQSDPPYMQSMQVWFLYGASGYENINTLILRQCTLTLSTYKSVKSCKVNVMQSLAQSSEPWKRYCFPRAHTNMVVTSFLSPQLIFRSSINLYFYYLREKRAYIITYYMITTVVKSTKFLALLLFF